jgi:hypothetical protein
MAKDFRKVASQKPELFHKALGNNAHPHHTTAIKMRDDLHHDHKWFDEVHADPHHPLHPQAVHIKADREFKTTFLHEASTKTALYNKAIHNPSHPHHETAKKMEDGLPHNPTIRRNILATPGHPLQGKAQEVHKEIKKSYASTIMKSLQ